MDMEYKKGTDLKFPILQIQSAQGPFFYKEDHSGFPSTGKPVILRSNKLSIKDDRGRIVGQIIIPVGFSVTRA